MLACLYCRTFEFRKKQAKQRDDDDAHTHLPNCILYLAHVIGIELAANLKLYLCLVKNSARARKPIPLVFGISHTLLCF